MTLELASRNAFASALAFLLLSAGLVQTGYDPLTRPAEPTSSRTLDLVVRDDARERDVPVKVYLPAADEPAPVVLFSHGLGGSREGCAYLGEHWSARGYVAVFLQHAGSDTSVWKDVPRMRRMAAMKEAASGENLVLRVADVSAVLDRLEAWNGEDAHELRGRLDLECVGMSGHSFGAVTTQWVGGQSAGRREPMFVDERVDAALALSPSAPRRGDAEAAFAEVVVPWMLMTGTRDGSPIDGRDPATRLEVYPELPETIDRYELVLLEAAHSAFSDRALPGDSLPRNLQHHRAVLALSTAFFDAHLRGDAEARAWLHGEGARSVLEPGDRWQLAEREAVEAPGAKH